MSLAEIKDCIEALSVENRLELAAWIAFLNRAADPAYSAEIEARMSRMDAGHKATPADLARIHAELNAKGQ
jgi:hypothetical protein